MGRRRIAISTGIASLVAIATVAVIATAGSAQSPAGTTLNFVTTNVSTVGFGPNHAPRPGDRFGFGSTYKGDDTGYDRAVCTVIGRSQAVCTIVVKLSKGTLTAQGLVSLTGKQKNAPFPITGGTGAYNGARGTAFVTDVSSKVSDIQVQLLP